MSFDFEERHVRHCLLFAFQQQIDVHDSMEMIRNYNDNNFGPDAPSYSTCNKWYQQFKSGNFDLHYKHSGQLNKVTDEDLAQLLENDPYRAESELAKELGVTQQTISVLLDNLKMTQKEGKWVPRKLTDRDMFLRDNIASALLYMFEEKDFLHKIVCCDEKWIFYNNAKRQKLCVDPDEPSTSTARPNIHTKKVLLCVYWDERGIIDYELLQPGETLTVKRYQTQIIRLSKTLEVKRPCTGNKRRKIILLQDNERLNGAKTTLKMIRGLRWSILEHPPHSPDLDPSDYHLYKSLQHHLADTHLTSVEDVDKSITEFINSKQPSFFKRGIQQLPDRWQECIESEGDYLED